MGPKELTFKSDDEVKCYACSTCGQLHGLASRDLAERCCNWRCNTCGEKVPNFSLTCDGCQSARREVQEAEQYAKVEKVLWQDYQGEVMYLDETYFLSLDEVDDHFYGERPDHVYATTRVNLHLDAVELLGGGLSEAYEGAYDAVRQGEVDRLQGLLDDWCEEQDMHWFEPNEGLAVILPKPARDEGDE